MHDYKANHIRWEHWCYGIQTERNDFIVPYTGGTIAFGCTTCHAIYEATVWLVSEGEAAHEHESER